MACFALSKEHLLYIGKYQRLCGPVNEAKNFCMLQFEFPSPSNEPVTLLFELLPKIIIIMVFWFENRVPRKIMKIKERK
jgi:hypothetical protein